MNKRQIMRAEEDYAAGRKRRAPKPVKMEAGPTTKTGRPLRGKRLAEYYRIKFNGPS